MPTIIDLVTKFTADVGNFKKDIDSAEQKVSHLHVTLKDVAKVAAGVAVAGVAALSAAVVGSIATTIHWAGTMEDAGRVMGTTAEQTAGLTVIAKETGGNIEDLSTQVAYLGKNLEDEKGGLGTSGKALKELGISAKDVNGNMRPTIDIIQEVADKLAMMPDSLHKTDLQMQLLGKSGKGVGEEMERLAGGGLTQAMEKAKAMGLVVGKDAADNVDKLETSLADVKLMAQGFAITLGTDVMPVVQPLITEFFNWGVNAMPKVAQGIKDAIPFIQDLAKTIGDIVDPVVKLIVWLDKQAISANNLAKSQSAAKISADGLGRTMKQSGSSYEEYLKTITDTMVKTGLLSKQDQEAMLAAAAHGKSIDSLAVSQRGLTDDLKILNDTEYANLDTVAQHALAADYLASVLARLAGTYQNSTFDLVAYEIAQGKLNETAVIATAVTKDETIALWDQNVAAHDAAVEIGDKLSGAYDKLKTAQQSWLTNVGSAALAAMENTKYLSKTQQEQIKEVIDAATGSTYVATDQMNADLAAAMLEFKKTGDPEQLKKDIEAVAAKFEEKLAPNIKAAKDEVIKLQAELDELNNRHITTYIDIVYKNNPPSVLNWTGSGGTGSTGQGSTGRASGGLVSQPGLYKLAELGPELVLNADQTRKAMSGGGGIGGVVHHHYYEIAANYKYQEEKDIVQAVRQLQMLEG